LKNDSKDTLLSCPNCGYNFHYDCRYCPECGQKNHSLAIPFKHVMEEVLESTLHFDTKLVHSLKLLIFKPGILSAEFISGRRMRYVPPIRLYIFISFMFFFLYSLHPHFSGSHPAVAGSAQAQSSGESQDMKMSVFDVKSEDLKSMNDRQIDSLIVANGMAESPMKKYILRQFAQVAKSGKGEFKHLVLKNISYMMFILMPFFSFLVYLFYRKTIQYYMSCLVISIHMHSFIFLLLTLSTIIQWFFSSLILDLIVALVVYVYLFLMLRNVFRQKALVTHLKAVTIGILYFYSMLMAFGTVLLISITVF
jgi:hypothetical protein